MKLHYFMFLLFILSNNIVKAASCTPQEKLKLIKLKVSVAEIDLACGTKKVGTTTNGKGAVIVNVNNNSVNNSNATNTNTQTNAAKLNSQSKPERFFWQIGVGLTSIDLKHYSSQWDSNSRFTTELLSVVFFPSTLQQGNFGIGAHWFSPQRRNFTSGTFSNNRNTTALLNQYGVEIMYDAFSTGKNGIHILPLIDVGTTTYTEMFEDYSYSNGYSYRPSEVKSSGTYVGFGLQIIEDNVNSGSGWYMKGVVGNTSVFNGTTDTVLFSKFIVGWMW